MKFDVVLQESFKRLNLKYSGTRPDYDINDPSPYILVIDDEYNVDGKGRSILGINLDYYKGDVKELINKINKADNEAGYRMFDVKKKIKRLTSKNKEEAEEEIVSDKKKRYENLIKKFPELAKYIRRYKYDGITNQKRALRK